jgi:hypothetical protein
VQLRRRELTGKVAVAVWITGAALAVSSCQANSEASPTPSETSTATPEPTARPLFVADLSGPDRLLSNEYAKFHPKAPNAVLSRQWEVTSGSLFLKDGYGWTGVPDSIPTPDARSAKGTNSSVFRMDTRDKNFGNVRVDLRLRNLGLLSKTRRNAKATPDPQVDGIHLFLRRHTECDLYAVSLNRRDNTIVVKRKLPGGPTNCGRYEQLGSVPYRVQRGAWQNFSVTIKNTPRKTVSFTIEQDGKVLLKTEDKGVHGHPIWLSWAFVEREVLPAAPEARLDALIGQRTSYVQVDDASVAMNLNTPEEVRAWELSDPATPGNPHR